MLVIEFLVELYVYLILTPHMKLKRLSKIDLILPNASFKDKVRPLDVKHNTLLTFTILLFVCVFLFFLLMLLKCVFTISNIDMKVCVQTVNIKDVLCSICFKLVKLFLYGGKETKAKKKEVFFHNFFFQLLTTVLI